MEFVNWEYRPALLTDEGEAYAVLAEGEEWIRVDWSEVCDSGYLISEEQFNRMFGKLPSFPTAFGATASMTEAFPVEQRQFLDGEDSTSVAASLEGGERLTLSSNPSVARRQRAMNDALWMAEADAREMLRVKEKNVRLREKRRNQTAGYQNPEN